jgi:hypothetical protein
MARSRYTEDQIAFLREWWPQMRLDELTEAFNYVFDQDRSETSIKAALKNRKIRCGRKRGFKKGERLTYTAEQIEFITEEYKRLNKRELTKAFNKRFGTNKRVSQIEAFIDNHKIRCGRTGRFEKGNVPWTAGMAGKGVCKPNSGSFKKGNVPANIVPMYTERINKDGFVEIKVPIPNPYTSAETRFMHKHVWLWEQANGPVPEDHVIRFMDGDKTNCSLDNLGLFTRAESLEMTRLGFSEVDKDVKPTVAALGQLSARTKKAERELQGYSTASEVIEKVLELGRRHTKSGLGPFSAHQIQQAGWPHIQGRKATQLGISLALSHLVRMGKLQRVDRGLYEAA